MSERVRRMLLAVLVAGMAGTCAELMLTGHVEDFWQKVPVVLLIIGIGNAIAALLRPARWNVVPLRVTMVLFMCAGALGTFFHYESNAEFAAELTPGLSGFALLSAAMTRPTPPPLAPGTMIMLGLLGLIACYGAGRPSKGE